MARVNIFCEGITDQIFIADCLEILYGINISKHGNKNNKDRVTITFKEYGEIIDVGGCTNLSNELFTNRMKDTSELDGINLVIFDADFPENVEEGISFSGNKGFSSCEQKLKNLQRTTGVKFDYFIWPNHNHDGEIENLLRQLVPLEREDIFKCIESHRNCLESLSVKEIKSPDLKAMINFYLHTMMQESALRKRNYKESNLWNLNFEQVEGLNKLKLFLDKYFTR